MLGERLRAMDEHECLERLEEGYVGRLALCRVHQGHITKGRPVAWCRLDGRVEPVRIAELYVTEALDRVEADQAGPGEIIAVAGLPEVTIGETLADPDDPRPLPVITVDSDLDRDQFPAAGLGDHVDAKVRAVNVRGVGPALGRDDVFRGDTAYEPWNVVQSELTRPNGNSP
jgi:hypothetical protein